MKIEENKEIVINDETINKNLIFNHKTPLKNQSIEKS